MQKIHLKKNNNTITIPIHDAAAKMIAEKYDYRFSVGFILDINAKNELGGDQPAAKSMINEYGKLDHSFINDPIQECLIIMSYIFDDTDETPVLAAETVFVIALIYNILINYFEADHDSFIIDCDKWMCLSL